MSLQVWLPLTKDTRNQGSSSEIPTLMGSGITYVNGKLGKAAQFPNSCDSCIHMTGLKLQTGSWTAWIKILGTGSGSRQCLISEGRDSYNDGVEFYTNQAGTTLYFKAHATILSTTITLNTWYHVAGTFGDNNIKLYVNGVLKASNTYTDDMTYTYSNDRFVLGKMAYSYTNTSNYFPFNGCLNDVRIYDHCLSPMEVKELSKGLVLHYPLNRQGWGQENLFIDSTYEQADSSIANSSTDWSKHFRRYNGSAGIHSFSDYTDTITLSTTGNLGVTFQRKATDINLDSTSYYTISCEAKSTQIARPLCIGLSYYNNSNSWVWRGGSNPTYFEEVNKWQKFTLTFKPDADTQYIDYCFTVTGVASGTDTFSIRHCKLEKGSVATPWCPNSSDALATTMGFNETIEYDTSGFCNNGTRTGTFSWTSDTPKYKVSTYMPAAATITHNRCLDNTDQEWSCAAWIKPTTTGNYQNLNNFNISNRLYHGTYPLLYVNSGTNDYYNYGNLALPANQWSHIVFVFKNSTGTKLIYINGENHTNTGGPNKTSTPEGIPDSVIIGSNYEGNLCDYREYATALSADDILELYQQNHL